MPHANSPAQRGLQGAPGPDRLPPSLPTLNVPKLSSFFGGERHTQQCVTQG